MASQALQTGKTVMRLNSRGLLRLRSWPAPLEPALGALGLHYRHSCCVAWLRHVRADAAVHGMGWDSSEVGRDTGDLTSHGGCAWDGWQPRCMSAVPEVTAGARISDSLGSGAEAWQNRRRDGRQQQGGMWRTRRQCGSVEICGGGLSLQSVRHARNADRCGWWRGG